jgi:hypothetical protein
MTLYRLHSKKNHMFPFRSVSWGERYTENDLEDWLEGNPQVVTDGEPILIIARQPSTPSSGTPDLIGVDADGNTVIIELKRGMTPRDVIAQALEYAAWLDGLDQEGLISLAENYLSRKTPPQKIGEAWREAFAPEREDGEVPISLPAGLRLNEHQRIVLVLEGGDERTANVVRYLRGLGVDIYLVEYRFYLIESGEEILDVQIRVGRETRMTGPISDKPTLEKIFARWPEAAREPFHAFQNTLLQLDPRVVAEPKKSAISFYKQSRDGRVYIGSYGGSQQHVNYWFRKDSLQDRLDLPAAIANIKARTPPGIVFSDEWDNDCSFRIPFSASHTRQIAELVAEQIAGRIE